MKLSKLFHGKKLRKFPIRYDQTGYSLRARCFELFEQGQRPAVVAGELNMKEDTAFRYFTDWKRIGPNFNKEYSFVKELVKKTAKDRDSNVELFAKMLGTEKEKFEAILENPHGLKRFLTGRLYFPIMEDADHKRHMALQLGILMADHLINNGGKFEDVFFALQTLMQKSKQFRQDNEYEVEANDKAMAFMHRLLEVDLENERKGVVRRDRLSDEEIDYVFKIEKESWIKKIETAYWNSIAALTITGLTREQARDKMYQDLLNKGETAGAKALRAYQDIVHPLKSNQQSSPPSSSEPPLPQ